YFQLSRAGASPSWITGRYDLGQVGYLTSDRLQPPIAAVGKQNITIDQSWNTIKMMRDKQTIKVSLNDQPLLEVPVAAPPRPGIMRPKHRSVKIRKITLTGDWPETLPANLNELHP
ncbi:MAG: DUF1583 domain-containing protein, partial [Rubripirellula sp.]